ncbi:MAG: M16 family metallopeptidase [Gemmatimonadota bacterium]
MPRKPDRTLWAAGLLCLIPVPALAQEGLFHTELENGLDVIVVENSIVPLATVEIDVRNGAFTESPEYDGLSHLYEHMFFKANEEIPDQERFLERTRELGMVWNGTTSEERVNYFFTLSKENLAEGLDFMRAAIMTPLFAQEELVKERPVVTGEYDRAEANPFFHLFRAVDEKLWYEHFSRKNVIGDRDIILTATEEKMRTVQKRYYIPNNSALFVAGDVDHEEVFRLAREKFGAWERGPDPFELYAVPEHPPLTKDEVVVVEKPVNAVTFRIAMHGPSASKDEKATYAADVLSFIVGQRNSEFQKKLVDSGLTTGVSLSYTTLDHTGPINIFSQTTPEKFAEATKTVFEQIDHFTDPDYFTDEQLENAKTQLAIGELYGQERPSTFVHTLGFWWSVTDGLDYYAHYVENLRKVTREDVAAYVRKYMQNRHHVLGILVSPEDRAKLTIDQPVS